MGPLAERSAVGRLSEASLPSRHERFQIVDADTHAAGLGQIGGAALAALAQELADGGLDDLDGGAGTRSARNHLTGIVTRVTSDLVMSQVELQCGRYRVVSLISTEAVEELGLQVGSVATAVIKATNVTIEGRPERA